MRFMQLIGLFYLDISNVRYSNCRVAGLVENSLEIPCGGFGMSGQNSREI